MPDKLASILLAPAGLLYGVIMSVRNALYDSGLFRSWRSPIPVISVGNITTGGTGKTPLTDWIVKFYHRCGKKTAIVSRGYGRSTKGPLLVSDGKTLLVGSREAGDEVAMLAARNPASIVVVAENRREGVELILRELAGSLPEVIVLDDAFQHRRIARDLDIVVINAEEPFGRGRMLPAGRLREPLRGLRRADLIILNKVTDEHEAHGIVEKLKPAGKPVILSRTRPGKLVPVDSETAAGGEKIEEGPLRALAFAGIAAPDGFVRTLGDANVQVVKSSFFRDHQPFTADSLRSVVSDSKRLGLIPVTTEKDWFRIRDDRELRRILEGSGCRFLQIEPDLSEGSSLLEKMLRDLL